MWTNDKEHHLLTLIRDNPILYDEKHPKRRSSTIKCKVWNDIANSVGLTKDQIRYKWRTLQKTYGEEQELSKTLGIESTWLHYKAMSFLNDVKDDALLCENTTKSASPPRQVVSPSRKTATASTKESEPPQVIMSMKNHDSNNPDWHFFLSVLPVMGKIKIWTQKLQFRMQVTQLLTNYLSCKELSREEEFDNDDVQLVDFRIKRK